MKILLSTCITCTLLASAFLLARFFVVEDTILHTSQSLGAHKGGEDEGLVTKKIVNEFWQMALSEVLAVLRNNCVSVEGKVGGRKGERKGRKEGVWCETL